MSYSLPPRELVAGLEFIFRQIFPVLQAVGQAPVFRLGTLTSWWRTKRVNAAAGGAADSQHLIGLAWDIDFPTRAAQREAGALLRRAGFWVKDDYADGHIHFQVYTITAATRPLVQALIRLFAR